MSLKQQLNDAIKDAMKNKDNQRRDAIRLFTSAVKQHEVDTRQDADDDTIIDILTREAKKRRESIEELTRAGRTEQADNERYELQVIESFLPTQLTRDEITALIQEAITQTGATSVKEMGKVMGVLSPQIKGRADGKLVSTLVREQLTG